MNARRVATLLRELAKELDGGPEERPKALVGRRRIFSPKPSHEVTEEDKREARRLCAKRGIPV